MIWSDLVADPANGPPRDRGGGKTCPSAVFPPLCAVPLCPPPHCRFRFLAVQWQGQVGRAETALFWKAKCLVTALLPPQKQWAWGLWLPGHNGRSATGSGGFDWRKMVYFTPIMEKGRTRSLLEQRSFKDATHPSVCSPHAFKGECPFSFFMKS